MPSCALDHPVVFSCTLISDCPHQALVCKQLAQIEQAEVNFEGETDFQNGLNRHQCYTSVVYVGFLLSYLSGDGHWMLNSFRSKNFHLFLCLQEYLHLRDHCTSQSHVIQLRYSRGWDSLAHVHSLNFQIFTES